jgi:hypothetical protein
MPYGVHIHTTTLHVVQEGAAGVHVEASSALTTSEDIVSVVDF